MRRPTLVALTIAGSVAVSTLALATVNEPNGLQVPLDSMNGEVQLFTMFASLGDPVDWLADAASTPNQFSPLCGFTATFTLHESACVMDFAWYNETGQPPQASDLHVIIPAGSPIGQTFTGTDIKNDPNYLGGLVGFALVANGFCNQNHFANPQWNPEYTAGVPWIAAVIYPSKTTPNAYYIAFEDGPMVGTSFNNDGDFNDDVFFLTGLTCSGGGQTCDTGLPGICGPGITQCTANGVVCDGVSDAAPSETCNGLDDDCNGDSDEGPICPPDFVCQKGTCVQSCAGGEFPCTGGLVCNADGFCVKPECEDVDCPSGEVCIGGICKGPCDDVTCPFPQVCRVGACVDPCSTVTCDQGQVCDAGVCLPVCDCLPCAVGDTCQPATGLCVETGCLGVDCAAGTHCVAGQCVDSCAGATCPAGQTCELGQCVPDTTGAGGEGGSVIIGTGGGGSGAGADGGSAAGGSNAGASGAGLPESSAGCGCRSSGGGGEGALLLGVGLAFAAAAARRRRR